MEEESEESLKERHRAERKNLQAEIQKLKHSVGKGDKKKKKEVTTKIALLEAELDQRHENELQQFQENNLCQGVSDVTLEAEDSAEKKVNKKSKAKKRREKKEQDAKDREERIKEGLKENLQGPRYLEMKAMKEKLKARELAIHEVPSDGDCLYAAIRVQLQRQNIQSSIEELRKQAANYIRSHYEDFMPFLCHPETGDPLSIAEFEEYCVKLESTTEWGGQLEIQALSSVLKVPIEVIQADSPSVLCGEQYNKDQPTILLSYHRHSYKLGEHYNAVKPQQEITPQGSDEEDEEIT